MMAPSEGSLSSRGWTSWDEMGYREWRTSDDPEKRLLLEALSTPRKSQYALRDGAINPEMNMGIEEEKKGRSREQEYTCYSQRGSKDREAGDPALVARWGILRRIASSSLRRGSRKLGAASVSTLRF